MDRAEQKKTMKNLTERAEEVCEHHRQGPEDTTGRTISSFCPLNA